MVNSGLILKVIPGREPERANLESRADTYWIPGLRLSAQPGMTGLLLRGENPVAPGLQSDDIAGPELPVPRGVDLEHGHTLAC